MSERNRITLLSVTAENFRRLRVADIRNIPESGLVEVTGPNAAGKTTVLRTILEGLGGKRGTIPESIVNDASEDGRGWLRLDLSNGFTVEKVFRDATDKGTLHVIGPDRGRHGQTTLSDWIGPYSFDPLALFDKSDQEIADLVLSVAGDPGLKDRLSELRARRTELEDERRPFNSTVQRVQRMDAPEGERPQATSIADDLVEQKRLRALLETRTALEKRAGALAVDVQRKIEALDAATNRVSELRAQLEAALAAEGDAAAEVERMSRELDEAREAFEAAEDPTEELAAVDARLDDFERVQQALEPWREWDRSQAELERAKEAAAELTDQLRELDEQEAALVSEADIPVEGVTFTKDGGLRLNGRSLKVASGGERIRFAAGLATAVDSDLGIALIDEANDVGREFLDEIHEDAVRRGYQVWICRLEGTGRPGQIVVEDGVARDATTAAQDEGGAD